MAAHVYSYNIPIKSYIDIWKRQDEHMLNLRYVNVDAS